jgi:hypothetical protein
MIALPDTQDTVANARARRAEAGAPENYGKNEKLQQETPSRKYSRQCAGFTLQGGKWSGEKGPRRLTEFRSQNAIVWIVSPLSSNTCKIAPGGW